MPRVNPARSPKRGRNVNRAGLYSRHFSLEERRRLAGPGMPAGGMEGEIAALRVVLDRVFERLDACGLARGEDGDLGRETLNTIHTLALVTRAIAALVRSQQNLSARESETETAILDALAAFRQEQGL